MKFRIVQYPPFGPEVLSANIQASMARAADRAAELRHEEWRRAVSQNWLNAMLDIEIGC